MKTFFNIKLSVRNHLRKPSLFMWSVISFVVEIDKSHIIAKQGMAFTIDSLRSGEDKRSSSKVNSVS